MRSSRDGVGAVCGVALQTTIATRTSFFCFTNTYDAGTYHRWALSHAGMPYMELDIIQQQQCKPVAPVVYISK